VNTLVLRRWCCWNKHQAPLSSGVYCL